MTQNTGFQIDLNEKFPHLTGAPIVEAVIHWRARSVAKLQSAEVKSRLVECLSEYPDCRDQNELRFAAEGVLDGDTTLTRQDRWQGFRFTAGDGRQIAQFNRDGLVFSRLEPYEDWITFSAEALRLWQLFVEVAEPVEVQRLGVRFINRIDLSDASDVENCIRGLPHFGDQLGLPLTEFMYRSLCEVPGHPYRVNLIQTIQPPSQASGARLILDTDVSTTKALPCDETILRTHLTEMRWLKNKAFFSQVTDSMIDRFKGAAT